MNLRRSKLAEEILEGISVMDIPSGALVCVYLPSGLDSTTTGNIGESVSSILRAIDKQNPILLMPKDIDVKTIDESEMKKIGWVRDVNFKSSDLDNSGLYRCKTSIESNKDIVTEYKVRFNQTPNNFDFGPAMCAVSGAVPGGWATINNFLDTHPAGNGSGTFPHGFGINRFFQPHNV